MTTLLEIAARLQAAGAMETMLLVIAKATLILAIARLLLLVMPRASAATKHVVATAALVAVAAMPVMTLVVPAWHIAVEKSAAAPQPQASGDTKRTIGASDAEDDGGGVTAFGAAISVARATGVVPDEPLTAMTRAMNVTRSTWKGVIALSLIVGSLLMLAQMFVGMAGVWYVAKNAEELTDEAALAELDAARDALALRRDVRLLRSSRISVPVLWGFFKPVLLLPMDVATWPAERLRVVLMHELAHLVRFDGISLIATRAAVAIFWYHPLAWSLDRAGRSECERSCDDLVLAAGAKPSEYADHLLAIARSMPTFDPFRSVTLAMSRKTQLEGRLLSILQPQVVRRVLSGRGVAIACAAAVAFVIPFSALRLTAEQSKPAEVRTRTQAQTRNVTTAAGSEVNVTSDIDAIGDYLLAKLGKIDKRADRFLGEPKDGEAWYERAYDLYRNDRHEEAAAAFSRAAAEGYAPGKSLYNAACSWALLGDARRSAETLDAAIDAGWDDFEKIADDSDFDPIRTDPGFARVVARGGADVATRRVTESKARYEQMLAGQADAVRQNGVAARTPKADEWFEVGLDLLRVRQIDQSIDAFLHAIREGDKPSTSMYNLACAYSLKGDAREGMRWLERAVESGYSGDEKLANDPDLALLRTDPAFRALREKAEDLELKGCCDRWWKALDNRDGWREAAEHHRLMTTKHPQSGRAWFNLGYTALQGRDFATALDAFNKALSLNYRPSTTSYNVACIHALQGNKDAAFQWLDKARAAGFDLRGQLEGDEDLDSLHGDPRWERLVAEVGPREDRKWKYTHRKKRS